MSGFVRTLGFRIRQRGLAPALEGLNAVDDRLERLDARITDLDGRILMLGARLDDVDDKMGGLEQRLDGVEGQLDKIDRRLSEMQDLLPRRASRRGSQRPVLCDGTRCQKFGTSSDRRNCSPCMSRRRFFTPIRPTQTSWWYPAIGRGRGYRGSSPSTT